MDSLVQTTSPLVETIAAGSPRELGRAQGNALREKIHAAREVLRELEAFRLRQPPWMPYRLYRWLAGKQAFRYLEEALTRDYPEMQQRLIGLAEGAGLSLGAAGLFNALEPLLSSVSGCTACPGACSAVAVRNSRSACGEPVIARNFDYLPLIQPFYTIRDVRPAGRLRSLEFTVAPLIGTVDGLNEAGLCIAYDYAFPNDEARTPAGPISLAIAEALQHCETVAEAAEFITARPRWGGGLLMLADAGGDLASLELSNTRSQLRRPAAGEDLLFHSNAYACPPLREVQIPEGSFYTEAAPTRLRGRELHRSSRLRDQRFHELLAGQAPLSPDDLQAIMSDHGADQTPGDATICVHGDYWQTTACMQYFPRSRRLRVSYSNTCQAHFEELQL